jgi:outer membrane protein, heavy metal efflux system
MRPVLRSIVVCLGLLGIAHAEPAPREPAPAVRALLADPAQLASWLRARDPLVDAQRARVEAARAAARQTHVLPNPQLNLSVSDFVIGQNNPTDQQLSLGQTLIYSAAIDQLFEIGKRGPRQAAAELRTRVAQESATGALGQRLGDTTALLGKVAYLAVKRSVVATNLEAATKLMALEKVRLDHKDLSALEFARIELDTQAIALQLARAESDVAAALAACGAVLAATCAADGLTEPTVLDVGAPLPAALPRPDDAIATRPTRVAEKLEVEALGWDATLAHNRRIPDPTLGLGYTLDNLTISGDQHQSLMFTLGIPLPIFDRGDHDEAAARATARAREAEGRAAVRDAQGQIEALVGQRAMLEAAIARLETDTVPKSAQVIDQTRRAFDLGQARLGDLLLVERAHRDLLLEVLDTRFDLFNVRAALRQQLGLDDAVARQAAGEKAAP